MLAAFEIRNDVVADGVGQLLGRQYQSHVHRSSCSQTSDQVGIFCGYGGCRNLRRILGITGSACVRQTKFRATRRTIQRSDSAETSGCTWPRATIGDRLSVSLAAESLRGHRPIKAGVEKNHLACYFVAPQRV